MKLFSNKKGDLSLSVNAIVILVIAIIFLGLAIGFTTKLIGSSKDKLLSGIDNVDISTPANADNPIVFDGKLEVKAGSKTSLKTSFYNVESTVIYRGIPYVSECYNNAGVKVFTDTDGDIVITGSTTTPVIINSAPEEVGAYKEQRYQSVLKANANSAGDFICVIGFKGYNAATGGTAISSTSTKQVAIKVTG